MTAILVLGPFASAVGAAARAHHLTVTETPDVTALIEQAASAPAPLIFVAQPLLADALPKLRENKVSTPVVGVGPATPALGVKAIRLGAVEYLTEPLDERLVDALLAKVATGTAETAQAGNPIAASKVTLELQAQARQYAASNATVLLRGESGTGKEVMSRFVHANSPRKNKPFIAVNCAAIPENLLESELFGHEKGSFSGALTKRIGKFQQADGGTLLLDEISEMDLSLQAKLLRAIQERVIDPIGAEKPVPVDIRLIATTNRNLEDYVAEGKFREDLYFRLSVVMLDLPPLRNRMDDIAPLATHFAANYAKANGFKTTPKLAPAAVSKLEKCYWKGNVRELENTMQRAILLAGNTPEIGPDHIIISPMSLQMMSYADNNAQAATQPIAGRAAPLVQAAAAAYAQGGATSGFVPKRLADAEADVLTQTLHFTRGNREIAADILGISVTILKEKLVSLGLAPDA